MPDFLRDLIRPAAELPVADVCLVGLPLDFGTVLEGGRAGAMHAPDALRRELRRYHKTYNLEHGLSLENLRVADAGNVDLRQPDHVENHRRIAAQLTELCRQYPRVVVLGGSHDGSYSTVRGLHAATGGQPLGGLNLDAHADVKNRLDLGSGTPFGRLLREGYLAGARFAEVGLHSNLNVAADLDFLREQGAAVLPLPQLRAQGVAAGFGAALATATAAGPAFVSFDIDGCASAYAPAVSAPSADGFWPAEATEMARLAGQHPAVRLFEVVELNPLFDRDNQTARLGATIVAAYLTGVALARG